MSPSRTGRNRKPSRKTSSSEQNVILLGGKTKPRALSGLDLDALQSLLGIRGTGMVLLLGLKEGKIPPSAVVRLAERPYQDTLSPLENADKQRIRKAISGLEMSSRKKLGDPKKCLVLTAGLSTPSKAHAFPLLLNVGLSSPLVDKICLNAQTDAVFWRECYARFLVDFGQAIQYAENPLAGEDPFEHAVLDELPTGFGSWEEEGREEQLLKLTERLHRIWKKSSQTLPTKPFEVVCLVVEALLALEAKNQVAGMPFSPQLVFQTMVFGNKTPISGAGALLSRHPGTGQTSEKALQGRLIMGDQRLELLSGLVDGSPLETLKESGNRSLKSLYTRLRGCRNRVDRLIPGVSLLEFNFEENKKGSVQLYTTGLLPVIPSPTAEPVIAESMAKRHAINKLDALHFVKPERFKEQALPIVPRDARSKSMLIAKGHAASPGAATGEVVFSPQEAIEGGKAGRDVILLYPDASPRVHPALRHCVGLLTSTGWEGSPAALSCLEAGIPCVVGSEEIEFGRDAAGDFCNLGDCTLRERDLITIDGDRGEVFAGRVEKRMPTKLSSSALQLLKWARDACPLEIRVHTDDADVAINEGADGIGFLRTEHLFLQGPLDAAQDLLFGRDGIRRKRAMSSIYDASENEFRTVLKKMNGKGVMIRLLDAPYHDFLPYGSEMEKEENPLLGYHGIRLGLCNTEILRMQTRAIFMASCALQRKRRSPMPEIMLPWVSLSEEVKEAKSVICQVATHVRKKMDTWPKYGLGFLVETPAAALQGAAFSAALAEPSGETPKSSEPKYTFATIDVSQLIQITLAMGLVESDAFLRCYMENGLLKQNPMREIPEVVDYLIREFVADAVDENPELDLFLRVDEGLKDWAVRLACDLELSGVCVDPRSVTSTLLLAVQLASGS